MCIKPKIYWSLSDTKSIRTMPCQVLKWDLRKAQQWATEPMRSIRIEDPTSPRGWRVHSIVQKPKDPRRLGFVATSGHSQWSGMVDLYTGNLVHLYKAPEAQPCEQEGGSDYNFQKCRQKAGWLPSSCTLITGMNSCTYFWLLIKLAIINSAGVLKFSVACFQVESHRLGF